MGHVKKLLMIAQEQGLDISETDNLAKLISQLNKELYED
jgi:hypothetical protein